MSRRASRRSPPFWEVRRRHAGTMDDVWLAERHPLSPEDFDFRFWQSATPNCVTERWLSGSEIVTLTNLHHEHPGAATTAFAWSETPLWSFTGGNDGATPYAGLALNANTGTLFGAAFYGGANGQGVVFSIPTTGGQLTPLYAFQGTGDGAAPAGTPVVDGNGNVLGTTAFTSLNSKGTGSGYGGIYELGQSNNYGFINLRAFAGGTGDGANPYAGLSPMPDNNGTYYGATTAGGSSGDGIVFKLVHQNNAYSYSLLYTFKGGSTDGVNCYGGVFYWQNYLYGSTVLGGSSFNGMVFKLPTSANPTLSILYSFTASGTSGGLPRGGVVVNSATAVFGTASSYGSGSYSGNGEVFELTQASSVIPTNLHAFTNNPDGSTPWSNLYLDNSSNLYGTTTSGGAYGYGTVFELMKTSSGYTYAVLYSFTGGSDGANPYAGLTMDSSGVLYGTTIDGGTNGRASCSRSHREQPAYPWNDTAKRRGPLDYVEVGVDPAVSSSRNPGG